MFIYKIALSKYANELNASGRAARWNPNKVGMIYTSSNRSLACLENVVHRGQLGLNLIFSLMTIEIDNHIRIGKINIKDLPENWKAFDQMPFTQNIGEKWIDAGTSAVLEIPSSIVEEEVNYLINLKHPDFKQIKLLKTEPFIFDKRIKL